MGDAAGRTAWSLPRRAVLLGGLLLLAFGLRLGIRLAYGEAYFWRNSYSTYYTMALRFVQGDGLCVETLGLKCAYWPPVYPLFLALTTFADGSYLPIVVAQAAFGAGTVLCSFLIGRLLFGERAGLIASLLTAFYPYYVMHDTALQETGLFTFLTAAAVAALLWARAAGSGLGWLLAGLFLGLAVLTRASLSPFLPLAVGWVALFGARPAGSRARATLVCLLPLSLLVGAWLLRTQVVVGEPLLSSQTGRFLWIGNNPETFSHYPTESIDLSELRAWGALTEQERREVLALAPDEAAQSAWFARKGLAYLQARPVESALGGLRKLQAAFSWSLSPAREAPVQAVHGLAYVPLLVLAPAGLLLARRAWRCLCLVLALFVAFVGVSALFWAHTSHRSFLDLYLQVFAAGALARWLPPLLERLPSRPLAWRRSRIGRARL
jgi:4-amino-4-deoxy-L-arabinose transferase-like glycosyltransferase